MSKPLSREAARQRIELSMKYHKFALEHLDQIDGDPASKPETADLPGLQQVLNEDAAHRRGDDARAVQVALQLAVEQITMPDGVESDLLVDNSLVQPSPASEENPTGVASDSDPTRDH